jgi:LPXTG-motif cell wall-anchored protein
VTNELVRSDTLPRTGGNDTVLLLAGAVLIGLALGVRRLRVA